MKTVMKVERTMDGDIKFRGVLSATDYPRLDPVDSALVESCSKADATSADWLLALEVLFRRAFEQMRPTGTKRSAGPSQASSANEKEQPL